MTFKPIAPKAPRRLVSPALLASVGGAGTTLGAVFPDARAALARLGAAVTSFPVLSAAAILVLAALACTTIVLVQIIKAGDLIEVLHWWRPPRQPSEPKDGSS